MGIFLGIASALSWGTSDLLARFATRKIGTFRTMLYMQLFGCALLTLVMPWLGGWTALTGANGLRAGMFGVAAGLLNTCSTLALYRSFEIGKMSVVAPLSASYPVLTMLLAALTGERLTAARLAGIALTILGAVVVARGDGGIGGSETAAGGSGIKYRGVGWALLAALGYGVMFWLLGVRVVPLLGAGLSVWMIRLTSVLGTVALLLVIGAPAKVPSDGAGLFVLGIGVLDTLAYVLNNFGMQHEQTSVVSVLSSLYGAVTVGLAAVILKESIGKMQWAGIGFVFGGIVLIGL
jgi:drug/metabolite transporter (DMT)-like permease